jgi:hypothetical protein
MLAWRMKVRIGVRSMGEFEELCRTGGVESSVLLVTPKAQIPFARKAKLRRNSIRFCGIHAIR